jgi:hypothetical protein
MAGSLKFKDHSPGRKQDPLSKITRAKRPGGVAQAVKYLPCKHEVLRTNSSTTKKKKKAKKNLNSSPRQTCP